MTSEGLDPSQAFDALKRLERELWNAIRRGEPVGLDELRDWVAWVGWGLGARPCPELLWLGPSQVPRSLDALSRQVDRVREVTEQIRGGRAQLGDLAWEVERLDVAIERAVLQLLEGDHDEAARALIAESDALKSAAWVVCRTRSAWDLSESDWKRRQRRLLSLQAEIAVEQGKSVLLSHPLEEAERGLRIAVTWFDILGEEDRAAEARFVLGQVLWKLGRRAKAARLMRELRRTSMASEVQAWGSARLSRRLLLGP